MKTLPLLFVALSLGLTACDDSKVKQAEAEAKAAAEKAEAVAKEAAEAAQSTGSKLKEKAGVAVEKFKETGAATRDVLEEAKAAGEARAREMFGEARAGSAQAMAKLKEIKDKASEFAISKLGSPEVDAALENVKTLMQEAKEGVANGLSSEKAEELKAKWTAMTEKVKASTANLDPAKKERLDAILASLKARWDAMLNKAGEEQN